ncbi:hypothetical protein V8G54_012360, partial [Vigna mungo]
YEENAEEVAQLANWTCPKCRGICNYSLCQSYVCRNRRGEQPTYLLYRNAKESGFKSVVEMFAMKKNLETSSNPLNESNMRKVFDLKKGEVEAIFKGIDQSPSLSTKNETNSWLKDLEDLIIQSYHLLNDSLLDWFQEGITRYYKLDLSKKCKLKTLLCDEALNTE